MIGVKLKKIEDPPKITIFFWGGGGSDKLEELIFGFVHRRESLESADGYIQRIQKYVECILEP